jgi:hypothetical protein
MNNLEEIKKNLTYQNNTLKTNETKKLSTHKVSVSLKEENITHGLEVLSHCPS